MAYSRRVLTGKGLTGSKQSHSQFSSHGKSQRAMTMEKLKKLEEEQKMIMLMQSHGIETNSGDQDSNRFVGNFILFLIQPCGELDLKSKYALISDYIPKISSGFLEEASHCFNLKGYQQQNIEQALQISCDCKSDPDPLNTNFEEMATVELDAMQRANSTLEDFCRSYFMFHGMDVHEPRSVFKYLPVLAFTESFIYQLDGLNEKILQEADQRLISKFEKVFNKEPFRLLIDLLDSRGFLSDRLREELKHGQEYWLLERKLCWALANGKEISVEDVIKAIHLKSFDYRVLNLLLYQLRGEQVNELHMDFLSVSEFLVEVADDLFDYEDDVLDNSFNILRMFVRIYGASAPTVLANYIGEAEEKYNLLLKSLDPQLSLKYQRRCEEATKEGGSKCGHSLGTWSMPPLILDEDLYRSSLVEVKTQ